MKVSCVKDRNDLQFQGLLLCECHSNGILAMNDCAKIYLVNLYLITQ